MYLILKSPLVLKYYNYILLATHHTVNESSLS